MMEARERRCLNLYHDLAGCRLRVSNLNENVSPIVPTGRSGMPFRAKVILCCLLYLGSFRQCGMGPFWPGVDRISRSTSSRKVRTAGMVLVLSRR